ncbi:hypothetical protein EAH84_02250 [Sphingomonas oligophenolica]|uniref:Uncharacterized protein n=2 Tax=Sphingomonas oligophenolica TaxID=301154 RepID=A0A502CV73_9SPHN|nr:hypothetical protein EAH84_02250 [Sphingomonas oligophenolica]
MRARRAMKSSEDTARRQLRAYVGCDYVTLACSGASPSITPSIKNFGQTPATNVVLEMYIVVTYDNPNGRVPTYKPFEHADSWMGTIDPGASLSSKFGIAPPDGAGEAMMTQVFTTIRYQDIFGARKWRRQAWLVADNPRNGLSPDTVLLDTFYGGNEDGEGEPPPVPLKEHNKRLRGAA